MHPAVLIDVLKRALKGRGITYARVAEGLGMSEAGVKRMFSRRDFTLQRLDDVCRIAGLDFGELAREATAQPAGMTHLTAAQEEEIISGGPKFMLIALCAVGNWTLEQILDTYDIPRAECVRCLARLDRHGIIELAPDNRIRSRIDRAFSWLPDGPFQRYFRARIESEYLASKFDRPGELFLFISGMLSRGSRAEVTARMRQIASEFGELHTADRALPLSERHGASMLLAIRPWEPLEFRALRRHDRAPVPAGRLLNPMLGLPRPLKRRSEGARAIR
jgi:hypothetical protein